MKKARSQQIAATDLLATLLQAPDIRSTVQEHMSSITEEFFTISGTYLEMVHN